MVITIRVNNLRALELKMSFLATIQAVMEDQLLIVLKSYQIRYPHVLLLVLGELVKALEEFLSG